ncbi:hypothetical protein AB0F15_30765 [Amycolatopsis sp. NPDC026612]|uniref:hypothetical protein n=1 Tax=Amycolatopsis sp. NPDC026612 TaxID=3155466 RepID=UPI0033CD6869
MTQIESFANAGDSLRPLEMVDQATPVSCFWRVAAGAFVGLTCNYAFEKGIDYVKNHVGGGHFTPGGVLGDGEGLGQASSDELLGLLDARF